MERQGEGRVAARIVGACRVELWGLSSSERLRRQLAGLGVDDVGLADASPPASSSVLLLRADHLFETRTLADLLGRTSLVLHRAAQPVAAIVPAERYAEALAHLRGERAEPPAGAETTTAAALSSAYDEALKKAEPPRLLPIRDANRGALERHLFDGAYKGVTDIVTKWVWPAPARAVVRACCRFGISPNVVTSTSVVLVLLVTWLFWRGDFGLGLLLGWPMTFFDTVDGKLARVTVHSTAIGHVLDKGTDLIHPPIWYIAWGYGLHAHGGPAADALWPVFAVILGGYVAGRLCEGAFDLLSGGFTIFTWRPLDSWFRLIIARRNPNLVLLTVALVLGVPTLGFYAVAVWTALSTLLLALRLLQAIVERALRGPLESWLKSVQPNDPRLSARVFARRELPAGLEAG